MVVPSTLERVCLVGSGNFGSAMARIMGKNTARLSDKFESTINMYVYEEMIDGKKITEIINETHENVKYLPGCLLPENVVAVPDLAKAVEGATILVGILSRVSLFRESLES